MIIRSLYLTKLNGSNTDISIKFNDDINILTGRNGSGKTTILKLIWYCVSSNIERAILEINFEKFELITSLYSIKIHKYSDGQYKIFLGDSNKKKLYESSKTASDSVVHKVNQLTLDKFNTSVFFPTFRRLEGGFSIDSRGRTVANRIFSERQHHKNFEFSDDLIQSVNKIQDALESHANRLSIGEHKFVSSISTIDIQKLITQKYNAATVRVDRHSKRLTNKIFRNIKEDTDKTKTSDNESLIDAKDTLNKIKDEVLELEKTRELIFHSIIVLEDLIKKIFNHKGIELSRRITWGSIDQSISSDLLSAGEKQMLSFLCYNALYNKCPFFIDEPELSLHVDWQRMLLDVLIKQDTKNQFFISTHSPFIYTQYEDKEIMIGNDRGFSGE